MRFIQLHHRGWDHHQELPRDIERLAEIVDQPSAALVKDLKQRGLLEDTLVIWAGEFGRTVYSEGKAKANFGRDHHGRSFTVWMSGGGIKPGISYGETSFPSTSRVIRYMCTISTRRFSAVWESTIPG